MPSSEQHNAFTALEPPRVTRVRGDSRWQRWQMDSLDPRELERQRLAAEPPPPPPAAPEIDFGAIEAMREGARKEGYAQGYTQGQTQGYGDDHREGYARGLETARQEATRLQGLAGNFSDALALADDQVAHTLVTLALDVARQLVRGHLAANPDAVLAAARELLATEPALAGAPSLLLHPDDLPLVETHLQGELEAAGWTVRAEPGVERGGCIASAASGELDGRLATRWQRVVGALGRTDPWEPPHD
jgi:flagellar assembly protein FliH